MTRKQAREVAIHLVFEYGFRNEAGDIPFEELLTDERIKSFASVDPIYETAPDAVQYQYIKTVFRGVCDHVEELDGYIKKYSIDWNFKRISRIAIAIMRVAMYEILYLDNEDVPDKAAINEAVEIAKRYDTAETVSFINGIIGSFMRGEIGVVCGDRHE